MTDIRHAAQPMLGDDFAKIVADGEKDTLKKTLQGRFVAPPFSVLDGRAGYWLERKAQWMALGACTGEGLADDLQAGLLAFQNEDYGMNWSTAGKSVFDPVLIECMYRWFCPPGGHVLDPFAGEATKGIVAAFLDYKYTGCELRADQVATNQAQAKRCGVAPTFVQGDSAKLGDHLPAGEQYDFVFTSPPYYDLEVYKGGDDDGSTFKTFAQFMDWYKVVFDQAVQRLKPNRFVCVKIGEVRDQRGGYYNFLGENIRVFNELGLTYFNEAVLVTPVGTMAVRASRQFNGGRKLVKGHQNVLIFYKGDPRDIKKNFPPLVDA